MRQPGLSFKVVIWNAWAVLVFGLLAGSVMARVPQEPAANQEKPATQQTGEKPKAQPEKSQAPSEKPEAQTEKPQPPGDKPQAQPQAAPEKSQTQSEKPEAPSDKPQAPAEKAQTPEKPQTPVEKRQTLREHAWLTLDEGLTEKSSEKRAKAVSALGLLPGNVLAEKAAAAALKDENYLVRVAAAAALGLAQAARAVPLLESALDDDEPAVVLAAANSLMLLKANDPAYDVYYSVLTGTRRTNKGLIREQFRTLRDKKKMALMGFEEGIGFVPFAGIPYSVVKTVMKAENDASPVRAAAARKLAHDPNPAAGAALVEASHDKSWMIRTAALDAIAQRGDGALLPKVVDELDDTKDDVRYTAAACVIHLIDLPAKHRKAVPSGKISAAAAFPAEHSTFKR